MAVRLVLAVCGGLSVLPVPGEMAGGNIPGNFRIKASRSGAILAQWPAGCGTGAITGIILNQAKPDSSI